MTFRKNPGQMTQRSREYLEALKANGWDKETIARLSDDLPAFESLAIVNSFETALLALSRPQDRINHAVFLGELFLHWRAVCRADRNEALQAIACGRGKDSMAAQRLLAQSTKKKKTAADVG